MSRTGWFTLMAAVRTTRFCCWAASSLHALYRRAGSRRAADTRARAASDLGDRVANDRDHPERLGLWLTDGVHHPIRRSRRCSRSPRCSRRAWAQLVGGPRARSRLGELLRHAASISLAHAGGERRGAVARSAPVGGLPALATALAVVVLLMLGATLLQSSSPTSPAFSRWRCRSRCPWGAKPGSTRSCVPWS